MTMDEETSIRAPCNLYTILQNLPLFQSAYKPHPFANALRCVQCHDRRLRSTGTIRSHSKLVGLDWFRFDQL